MAGDAGVFDWSYGAGLRVGLLVLGPPDQDRLETNWTGFRVGVGVEAWHRSRHDNGSDCGPYTIPGCQRAPYVVDWNALHFPLYVSYQASVGSFTSSESWRGIGIGVEGSGTFVYPDVESSYPRADIRKGGGERLGIELFLEWDRFGLDGSARLRPRISLGGSFPLNDAGDNENGFTGGFSIAWY